MFEVKEEGKKRILVKFGNNSNALKMKKKKNSCGFFCGFKF